MVTGNLSTTCFVTVPIGMDYVENKTQQGMQ